MNRFTKFFCNLMVLGVALALTTPALAGPTPTPPHGDPTPTPTATPTSTPTPTPTPFCDLICTLDKRCTVGDQVLQDSCTANAGDEVTYTYFVEPGVWVWEVEDDQLGVIGQTDSGTFPLTKTTTITETTTNNAWMSIISGGQTGCICLVLQDYDSVTVTVTTATPTASPTATPTLTPPHTPTPTAEPTCTNIWGVTKICTIGKGQSPSNNPKVSMCITGNIVDPDRLGLTAHRIPVCQGEPVTVVVTDVTGTPTATASGSLSCNSAGCTGVVNVTEKFKVVSFDGKDTDRMTLLPK